MLEKPDEQIQLSVQKELQELIGVQGNPIFQQVIRWTRAMPQYHVGHLQRVDEIQQDVARYPGLELAGNGLHGVGIPQCIHSGESAAERLLNSGAKITASI
jgi:oxygen-dependent protoporphyrinogen oxidase